MKKTERNSYNWTVAALLFMMLLGVLLNTSVLAHYVVLTGALVCIFILRTKFIAALSRAERAESAHRKSELTCRAKDQFISIIAHELKKPLSAVQLSARRLAARSIENKTQLVLSRSASRMQALADDLQHQMPVDNLLTWSSMKNGSLELKPRLTDLREPINTAWQAIAATATCKKLKFQAYIEPGAEQITADPARLTLVLWNLLINSVKFTPPDGRISLWVARAGKHIAISVTDTGCGIPPQVLAHVFEESWPTSTQARQSGLGLGLSLVRRIIELHGGYVQAESLGSGKGATFTIILKQVLNAVPEQAAKPLLDDADHKPERIFVNIINS